MFFPKQLLNKGKLTKICFFTYQTWHGSNSLLYKFVVFLEQKFGQIVCQPASDLQVRMRDYVISHVFNDAADEDQSDDENEENEGTLVRKSFHVKFIVKK